MIKRCEDIRDRIGALMDGELSRSGAEEVRVHLESCLACREEQRQLEKLQASLKEVLVAGPSNVSFERFWSGVEQRINRKRVWHEDFFGWVHDLLTPPQLAWLGPAGLILGLTGGVFLELFF